MSLADDLAARLRTSRSGDWYRTRGYCHAGSEGGKSLAFREADTGGLALKCFAGCARDDVLKALERESGLSLARQGRQDGPGSPHRPFAAPTRPKPHPAPDKAPARDTQALARQLWAASTPISAAPEHPARRWMAARNLWRPEVPAPDSLRWLPVDVGRAFLRTIPEDLAGPQSALWTVTKAPSAGALIAILARPSAWVASWPEVPAPEGLTMIGVAQHGGGQDKRPFGPMSGLVHVVGQPSAVPPYPLEPVHVVEGLADAVGRAARYEGPVVATLGSGAMRNPPEDLADYLAGWPHGCQIVADNDVDGARNEGLRAGRMLARAVEAKSGKAAVVHAPIGKDYADTCAAQGFPALADGWKDYGAQLRELYPDLPRSEIGRLATITFGE